MNPDYTPYVEKIAENVEYIDSNYSIKNDSNLSKYITYCDGRTSPFGVVDVNILGALEKGNVILNSIPIIGSILDIINSVRNIEFLDWATGKKCVNDGSDTWKDTFAFFQRFVEDQRILDWSGAGTSMVLAYEIEYEKANPTDNSMAGYLARISGISKSDAEDFLTLSEYYTYLAEYDPETRLTTRDYTIATDSTVLAANFAADHPTYHIETQTTSNPIIAINNHTIIYSDIRNRSYAV